MIRASGHAIKTGFEIGTIEPIHVDIWTACHAQGLALRRAAQAGGDRSQPHGAALEAAPFRSGPKPGSLSSTSEVVTFPCAAST